VYAFETYQPDGVGPVAPANFVDWRDQNEVFAGVAAYRTGSRNIQGQSEPEHVSSVAASANLFNLLGVSPKIGRVFTADDNQLNQVREAVISDGLWQRDFGGRSDAIGQTISVDQHPYSVIGVMPASFRFPPNNRTDLWLPLELSPNQARVRDTHYLKAIARLKDSVSLAQASAQMRALVSRLQVTYPKDLKGRSVRLVAMHDWEVSDIRLKMNALMTAVLLVLAVSCANIANLLLARSAGRAKEVSIRIAIGASAMRLVRQFLTESVVLTFLGGAAAIVFGWIGLRLMWGWTHQTVPYLQDVGMDWRVGAFLALLCLGTAVLFGIVPAVKMLRVDIQAELRNDLTSFRLSRIRKALVVGEVAFSLMLLIATGLLMRSLFHLFNVQTGFDPTNVITMHLSVQPKIYKPGEEVNLLYEPVIEKVRHLPGVRAAGLTSLLPLQDWGTDGTFQIKGHPALPGQEPSAEIRIVSADYFRTLGIPLRSGRVFSGVDIANSPNVAVINEALAQKYFPGKDALGQMLEGEGDALRAIVGIVGNVRQIGMDRQPVAEMYYPDTQASAGNWFLGDVVLVVKSAIDPASLVPQIRKAVQQVRADEPIFDIETMNDVISTSLFDRKLLLALLSVFAVLALGLSAIGLYGLVSYGVSQRTREFGIRMAIGADSQRLFWLILAEDVRLISGGVLVGLCVMFVVTRFLRSMLFDVAPTDSLTFVLSIVIIAVVGVVAGILPARRAAKTAPISALRYE